MTTQNGINTSRSSIRFPGQRNSRYTDAQRHHVAGLVHFLMPELTANISDRELVYLDENLEACVAAVPLLWEVAKTRTARKIEANYGEAKDKAITYDDELDEVGENWWLYLDGYGENTPESIETLQVNEPQADFIARLAHHLCPDFTDFISYNDLVYSDEAISMTLVFMPILFRIGINQASEGRLAGKETAKTFQKWAIAYQKSWRQEFESLGDTGKQKQVVDLGDLEPAPKAEVRTPIAAPATPAPAPQKKANPPATPRKPVTPKKKDGGMVPIGAEALQNLRNSLPEGPAADSELPLAPPAQTSVDASALQ